MFRQNSSTHVEKELKMSCRDGRLGHLLLLVVLCGATSVALTEPGEKPAPDHPFGFRALEIFKASRAAAGLSALDLDGDGRTELLLRGADAPLVQIFEYAGDNDLRPVGVLANDTSGDNDLSERQVVGDFDADGRPELAMGDFDGDLLLYGAALDDALSQLKPVPRKCVEMHILEQRTYDEIAQELRLPVGTVKSHLSRAAKKLRALLAHLLDSSDPNMTPLTDDGTAGESTP